MSVPFQVPNQTFKKLFRLNKETARALITMTAEHLQEGQRVTAIPVDLKVLATLHFYGTGGYQLTTGQGYNFSISQPSMSRCIDEVTNVIYNHLLPNWIVFPSIAVERNKIMEELLTASISQ